MALRDAFVNIAAGAAASAASRTISSTIQGVAAGLKGTNPTNPTAALDGAASGSDTILTYPLDVSFDEQQGHYVLFSFRKLQPGNVKKPKKSNKEKIDKIQRDFNAPKGSSGRGDPRKFMGENIVQGSETIAVKNKEVVEERKIKDAANNRSLQAGRLASSFITKTVALYMPAQVQASYDMKYGEAEVGLISEGIKNLIDQVQGGASLANTVKGAGQSLGQGAKQAAVKMLDTVAPGAKTLIALETGTIITPRTELMFEGIGRRNFSFTFTFIPKNASEASLIRQIVKEFKLHMTPEFAAVSGAGISSPREMNIPDVFDINYMYKGKENGHLNKISTCYLTKLDVTYGGDRYTAYEPDETGSPPPQRTTLAMSFSEIELIDKERIKDGF
ncbi:MAG: baseplate tail-tube junction protein [Candidatus Poseidoniales archaeon]